MTPELTIRTFTNDQYTLDKVFYANFYRLKGFKKEDPNRPVVLDLGAHAGYFSFAALSLGAKKIYAFEPMTDNFRILFKNLHSTQIAPAELFPFGVYTTSTRLWLDVPDYKDSYYDWAEIQVNGNSSKRIPVQCLTLDDILTNFIREDVGLLKINLGYAEAEILKASQELGKKVANICGEVGVALNATQEFQAMLAAKGYEEILFFPVPEREDKSMFIASKTKCADMFITN